MNSSSPDIFAYDQEAYDWPQWYDSTLEYDVTMGEYGHYSDWMLTDFLPGVEDQHKNSDVSSISEQRSSVLSPSFTLPPWTDIQSPFSPPTSAEPTCSRPASPYQQACRVCNDAASGMHFGVMSCEACKSFFRRSVRAEAKYVCRGLKSCEINKSTRNKCQHCRLQKCVDVGMKRNGKEV